MKKALLMGLNNDNTPRWVEVPEPAPAKTAHHAQATVSFTENDRQELISAGYHSKPDVLASCTDIPLKIASTPPEAIFGPGSSSKLAQEIKHKYPMLYWKIKENAVRLGLVVAPQNLKLRDK